MPYKVVLEKNVRQLVDFKCTKAQLSDKQPPTPEQMPTTLGTNHQSGPCSVGLNQIRFNRDFTMKSMTFSSRHSIYLGSFERQRRLTQCTARSEAVGM